MKRSALLATSALAGAVLVAGAAQAQTIQYAHFQPASLDAPKHAAALAFKSHVETNTDGELSVEIYPASQLGDGSEIMEGLQLGTIEMGVVHDGPVASVFEPVQAFMLPYVFRNHTESWAIWDGEYGQRMAEAMREETGIRVMAFADNGVRHFTNSQRPIETPSDLEGLTIRVQPGEIYQRVVSSLGASPQVVPWPELPGALQQGVVDGQENGTTNILAASLHQYQDYITLDGHMQSFHAYMMNDDFYQGLSDSQQEVVDEGVEIAKWIHRGMTSSEDKNAATILSERGLEVTTLTPDQVDTFREQAQQPVAEWLAGEIGEDWVDGLFEALEAHRSQ